MTPVQKGVALVGIGSLIAIVSYVAMSGATAPQPKTCINDASCNDPNQVCVNGICVQKT